MGQKDMSSANAVSCIHTGLYWATNRIRERERETNTTLGKGRQTIITLIQYFLKILPEKIASFQVCMFNYVGH